MPVGFTSFFICNLNLQYVHRFLTLNFIPTNMSLMSGTEGLQALSFLDLPREIRNEIYRLLLFPWGKHVPYSKTRLVTVEDCDCPEPCACNWKIDTDLFRVSAQISEEARHYFYSHCYFRSKENISCKHCFVTSRDLQIKMSHSTRCIRLFVGYWERKQELH